MAAKMAARKPTTKAPKGYATTGLPSRKVVVAVLKDINRIRKAEGWPPVRALLRGEPKNLWGCPVARTVGLGLDWYTPTLSRSVQVGGRNHPLSSATTSFIKNFDHGKYPGLRAPHA